MKKISTGTIALWSLSLFSFISATASIGDEELGISTVVVMCAIAIWLGFWGYIKHKKYKTEQSCTPHEHAVSKTEARTNVLIWIRQVHDCARILQTTTDPYVFFSRFDTLVELTTKLAFASNAGYIKLTNNIDINLLLALSNDRVEPINDFIKRAYFKACEDSESLKTVNGKENKLSSFFESMNPYTDKMEPFNVTFLQELQNGADKIFNETPITEKHFDLMDGHEFEHFCADLLMKDGFSKAEVTVGSGDHGVDILAEKDGITYAIQCKRSSSNIGNKAVQEIFSGKEFYKRHIGVVMTNQFFTSSAKEAAGRTGIVLWDREKIDSLLDIMQEV